MNTTDPSSAVLNLCSFTGNADLYGIGVRTGVYLQWIATLLTTLFEPADEQILQTINLLIQSAIFIGLILLTLRQGLNGVIEPVLSMWLVFGALSSLGGSGMNPIGHFLGIFRVVLYTAVAGYGCWFWFTGLDVLLEIHQGCIPVAFFGRTYITGKFRAFNKAASVIGLFTCVIFIFLCGDALFRRFHGGLPARTRRRPRIVVEYLILSVCIIVFSVAVVEYLLKENQITGINQTLSVGQLIPLLVGVISLGQVVLSIFEKKSYRKNRCWVLFGRHRS